MFNEMLATAYKSENTRFNFIVRLHVQDFEDKTCFYISW